MTSIPTPYRDPFWGEVAQRPEISQLDVYYCAKGKPDRPWVIDWPQDFNAIYLPTINMASWMGADSSAYWVRGLGSAIRNGGYDAVVVGGYNHPAMLAVLRGCQRRKQPYFLMCETYRRRPGWRGRVKDLLIGKICQAAAGGMPTGKLATAYLESYGISRDRMIPVPNVPNVDELARKARDYRENGQLIRESLDIPVSGSVLTFVGRMIPKKRPIQVIRAFASADVPDATLVMIGDGPQLAECKQLGKQLNIDDRIILPGFCQPDDVPKYLSVSSLFVLPSSETWGVAAIEAIAMGVPALLSDEVGSHPDIITSSECGEVVRAGCLDSLTKAIASRLPSQPASDTISASCHRFRYGTLSEIFSHGIASICETQVDTNRSLAGFDDQAKDASQSHVRPQETVSE